MRIAINARFLAYPYSEGYGNFIREIGYRLTVGHPETEFIFIYDKAPVKELKEYPNIKNVVIGPAARHPVLWKYWYDYRLPAALKKYKADVFLSADGFCSLRSKVPQCLVVHDLAFLHYPHFIPSLHYWYYKRYTPRYLKKAKQVITVSEFSKKDIIDHYHIPVEKIDVVYNAAGSGFHPADERVKEEFKMKYADGKEYFFFAGAIHPRKNLMGLLKAFSWFKKRQQSNMKLIIAGRLAWDYEELVESLKTFRFRDDVKLTGYLPADEISGLMTSAYALVYPSYFEGFGMPVLEAMQSGVPVIASQTSAIPEVAGKAALLVNPDSHEETGQAMALLYKDETLRSKLIIEGFERAKQFSWEKSATQIWELLIKTAS